MFFLWLNTLFYASECMYVMYILNSNADMQLELEDKYGVFTWELISLYINYMPTVSPMVKIAIMYYIKKLPTLKL